jgi:hypothetical protein
VKRRLSRGQVVHKRARWRTGVIALVLLGVTTAAALILAHRYHLGVAALVVGILGGLPALYLAWAALPGGSGEDGSLDLARVADQLAVAVGEQWQAEASVRRLNDPYPLPVSWDAAGPSLTDAWDLLVKLAGSGAGWPAPPPPGTWAAGPEGLAGSGGELVEVLARVPTGRLVVLGEPGSGKTMLMVRLVLDLLARRPGGGPVPVLVSVASWNPADPGQDLRGWLAERLVTDYPALAAAPPTGSDERTHAAALLAAGLITPILDGLDEIPDKARGPAVSKINDMLRPGEPLVVTCRSQQYQEAIRPEGGPAVTLRGAAAVQLLPLVADDVRGYLCDDAAGPAARSRWEPVFKVLGTAAPAGQALGTPLMVALARAIYNPRPGELAGDLRDPGELCKPDLADRAAVESVLFDAFIPSAYRQLTAGRWKAQDAQKWLVFLAGHLERKMAGPDLAWWQLPRAARGIGFGLGLVAGLWVGLGTGLVAGLGLGLAAGFGFGFGFGIAIGLSVGLEAEPDKPSRGMRLEAAGVVGGLGAGLVVGLGVGLGAGLAGGLAAGLGAGLVAGLGVGLASSPSDPATAASPRTLLARDRQAAILFMLGGVLVLGLAVVVVVVVRAGAGRGVVAGAVIGVDAGLLFVLLLSMTQTVWPSYMLARGWLALHSQLPWSLMSFLDDAHQRGVLRQVGAVYQFRHIELQHRLATQPSKPPGIS